MSKTGRRLAISLSGYRSGTSLPNSGAFRRPVLRSCVHLNANPGVCWRCGSLIRTGYASFSLKSQHNTHYDAITGEAPRLAHRAAQMTRPRQTCWPEWSPSLIGVVGEGDDGVDQLVAVEQDGIVVIGALDREQLPQCGCGFGDRAALLCGDDGVAGSVHHGDRRFHRRELDERRAQHEPSGRVLGREFDDDRGAQTLPVVEEAVAGHSRVVDQEPVRRAHVTSEAALARAARIAAVAAVVEQQRRKTPLGQRPRERSAPGAVAGIAVGHQDRHAAAGRRGRNEPGSKLEPITRLKHDIPRAVEAGCGRRNNSSSGQIDQASLQPPDQHQEQGDDRAHNERRAHHYSEGSSSVSVQADRYCSNSAPSSSAVGSRAPSVSSPPPRPAVMSSYCRSSPRTRLATSSDPATCLSTWPRVTSAAFASASVGSDNSPARAKQFSNVCAASGYSS